MSNQSFSLFIALRYCSPWANRGMASFLSLVSLAGLALGVFALIVVISVMNGFERELQTRMLTLLPHAQIVIDPKLDIGWPSERSTEIVTELERQPGIVGVAPYVESTVMLNANQRYYGANLTGIDVNAERNVSVLYQHIIAGDIQALESTPYGIVMGAILARQLGVIPGDKVNLTIPKIHLTPFGPITRQKRFELVAVFSVGAELDQNLVLINLAASQKLMTLGKRFTGLRVQVEDQFRAGGISEAALNGFQSSLLNPIQRKGLRTVDWREQNSSLFSAVVMEKIMIFLLLMSVVAVASFNIVSIILMTVTDKRSDIAVLRTMGASRFDIAKVFVVQGLTIGFAGTAVGAIAGILVAPNVGNLLRIFEAMTGWQLFDPSVYFIPYLPSLLNSFDVILVVTAAILMCLVATLYPAWQASRIAPAEALAYEH